MAEAESGNGVAPAKAGGGRRRQLGGHTGSLMLGAVGLVFGDIGTSPIYALRASFTGPHHLEQDILRTFGVISLIFWTMLVIVTCKYVLVLLRANNHGEGGSFALLALIQRCTGEKRWTRGLVLLGVLAVSLFYGDSVLTPAISVLSSVEGLKVVDSGLHAWVVPLAVLILVVLFLLQRRGSVQGGRVFGPIMAVWFLALAGLGLMHVLRRPEVLWALDPGWIVDFVRASPGGAFQALGVVVLAVTGAEALYADMGHFGRRPIALTWLLFVFPCLLLNYLGQCALLLDDPGAVDSPFFRLAPDILRLPLVILAIVATIIASQSVILGAFSLTRQAIQLGFMPRMKIVHISAAEEGQIYMPSVNWAMMVLVVVLVASFGASLSLAAAYGLAVTGMMLITTLMLAVMMVRVWRVRLVYVVPVLLLFTMVDLLYFASNLTKLAGGGWVSLLVALVLFTMLTTWSRGRALLRRLFAESALPVDIFAKSALTSVPKVPGTAVFLSGPEMGVPQALLHNIKHNKVLHERVVLLTVQIERMPFVDTAHRAKAIPIADGFWRLILRYGFLDAVDVPLALKTVTLAGQGFDMMKTSFFLSRQTLVPARKPGMALWREMLFSWMMRNATSAMSFFRMPVNRVVELGSQVEM